MVAVRVHALRLWEEIETWAGGPLPADYKQLVDHYGDAFIAGHLFLPHPAGETALLTFMRKHGRNFHEGFEDALDLPPRVTDVWEEVVPWGYHDWNGDLCLLLPPHPVHKNRWTVAVAYRQGPGFLLRDGGVVDFLDSFLRAGQWPVGWPRDRPVWESGGDK